MNADTNGIDLAVVKQPQVAVLGSGSQRVRTSVRVRLVGEPLYDAVAVRGR